jgi:hypothetical protein
MKQVSQSNMKDVFLPLPPLLPLLPLLFQVRRQEAEGGKSQPQGGATAVDEFPGI